MTIMIDLPQMKKIQRFQLIVLSEKLNIALNLTMKVAKFTKWKQNLYLKQVNAKRRLKIHISFILVKWTSIMIVRNNALSMQ